MVLSGSLQPGQRLVQSRLAGQFNVAQGVVRESLLELSCSGLVEAIDDFGVFVSKLGGPTVVEALEIREVLEGLAARLCCRRASREDIENLKATVENIHTLGCEGECDRALKMDRAFHQKIVEISRNETLEAVTASHWTLRLVLKMSFDVEIVYSAHKAIVDAIEQNQPDLAERLMRDHIRSGREVVKQMVQEGTFTPEWFCDSEYGTL